MKFAIETLQMALNTVKRNLRLLEKSNARDLANAAEFEATAESAPGEREHFTNAARGYRNSAAWCEERAMPAERQKMAELEKAIAVLREHSEA